MPDSPNPLDFEIDGPDGDDFVWLITKNGNEGLNLGRSADVAEKLSQWLASYDDGERE